MRPLELRLRNFRSYFGADSVFDFRERGLVGVVGPIGSGKSSLLDAIAFALYGRTATVASSTKSLIHQRADGATVSLRFAVDGEVWEVTRALRRKGQSVHGLERLEADEAEPERLEALVLEVEVNDRIIELLGLEFDGFSRSVMLAQGRFSEFLRSRPAERDKVLKGVFGHDRIDVMRAAAKERSAVEAARVEALSVRLEAADALAGRVSGSREQLAADEARLELLRKAEAKFADYAERVDATGRVIAHAETRLDELAALRDRLPAASAVDEVVRTSQSANETRRRLGKALDEAQDDLAAADLALAELKPAKLQQTIDESTRADARLQQLADQHDEGAGRIEQLEEEAAAATAKGEKAVVAAEDAVAAVDVAQAALADAKAAHELAAAALHDAQHADMAGTLRADLVPGTPCPVCAREVVELPAPAICGEAAEAEQALAAAAAAVGVAQSRVDEATAALAKAHAEASAQEAAIAATAQEIVTARDRLKTVAGERDKAAAALNRLTGGRAPGELRAALTAAEQLVADRRKSVDLARAEHDEAIRSAQAADKEIGALRLLLAELATRLTLELGQTEQADQVAAAVATVRSAWVDATETLSTARVAAEQERAEVAAAMRELRRELDIEEDFGAQLAKVTAAIELRRQQLESDEETLAGSAADRAERAAAQHRQKLYETLATELTDSRFVRFLLDEEKRGLANLGSEHFERLSSGRYRFSTDGEFRIVDLTSADAIRKADSLSGGETFLASLALALALAEMVSRTGGRLDAFFLDEGFGSLDPEHLDLAMEGIEQLAAGAADRLVLVVSHVTDMRHRLEDLIELDRDPVTGDTIVIHA